MAYDSIICPRAKVIMYVPTTSLQLRTTVEKTAENWVRGLYVT